MRVLTLESCAACGEEALTVSEGLQAGCEHLHATQQGCHITPAVRPVFKP